MWQKCPICNGTGLEYEPVMTTIGKICSICNGTKIISELTGLPPNFEKNKLDRINEDIPNKIDKNLKNYPEFYD